MSLKIISNAIILVWIISEIALAGIKKSGTGSSPRDRSSLRLIWIAIVLSIASAIVVAFSKHGAMQIEGHTIPEIGLIVIVAGLVLRWIAIVTLWRYFTVDVTIADDHRLITQGLYGIVRHPAYTGSILSFIGLGLTFSNWYSLAIVAIPVTTAFLYRIKVEEEALLQHFGGLYREYILKTKRLVPLIY